MSIAMSKNGSWLLLNKLLSNTISVTSHIRGTVIALASATTPREIHPQNAITESSNNSISSYICYFILPHKLFMNIQVGIYPTEADCQLLSVGDIGTLICHYSKKIGSMNIMGDVS